MLLIGKPAPHFSANAVVNGTIVPDFSLDQFKGKKYVILFFYPKDFTFVCPTELIGFQEALGEFEKRDVAVVGCSTDSEFSHWAWINTPRSQGVLPSCGIFFPCSPGLHVFYLANNGFFGIIIYWNRRESLSWPTVFLHEARRAAIRLGGMSVPPG